MNTENASWSSHDYCLGTNRADAAELATSIHDRVCRTSLAQPGFCAINLGPKLGLAELRGLMLRIYAELSNLHAARTQQELVARSAARFDQQETTRPHLDAGPSENLLLLGYEPSSVDSVLEVFDYSKCAQDNGLAPAEFLQHHNPMFQQGYKMLLPYRTAISCFSSNDYVIVCLNNSSAPFDPSRQNWQGVLHSAKILNGDPSQRRVINSMMVALAVAGVDDAVSAEELERFATTAGVKRRGYDKPDLTE